MEFEFWWLLALPVFFGMGWVAARVDLRSLLSESRQMPSSYFRGLNFLLNEQPDKAIESFLLVAKEHPDTVELQFALGSLFRRRGEVDRAIRMHQDLVAREDLPPDERRQASFELAEDYFKAGLLDHAEQVLAKMAEADPSADVHRQLLDIYIQEKDWAKAIGAAKKLEVSAKRNYQKEIANYYCELAITEQVHGRGEGADAFLAKALEANRKCVRANLLRGEWLARAGKHEEAIAAWKAIESQDPAYFGLAAEGMFESYRALGQLGEGLALLRGLQHSYPGLDLLNVVYQATAEQEGDEAAWRLVRDEVRRNPTLVGLDRLVDAELLRAPPDKRQDLQLMKNLVHSHAQALAVYLCANCGFRARQFFWQCPACGGWETFSARRTAELDTADRHLARIQIGQ
ncbi:lipopolysaccharide assembly protein LapB [Usitatibacter palustris]|uniref:Lipopolysaccharide assembly protein B n=1 Tax=Usitatibacter palustris TaxID=2732487 RepID=A0A6M4HC22_9PROT|nr:lipopolysaccharide assembly protein LapB [Usitatibacter palustris]QJR15537.1 Lipopolysaccharide assembly protein B [Usitatibacter palustris]